MQRELLDLLVLAALRRRSLHGYALIEELRRLSGGAFDLAEGRVYPALHRLEREGLLASRWSANVGRARRVYRLTGAGEQELAAREEAWRELSTNVGRVLDVPA
jgi:PadR family transcriptional regulator PadR